MASRSSVVFAGIKGTVLAIDRETGTSLWRRDLKGTDFVNLILLGEDLYAASHGRLYRLDPTTGEILWENGLPGLGWGIVTMAGPSERAAPAAEEKRRRAAAAAAVVAST
jgi:outer membrane protein assembly factor BamB